MVGVRARGTAGDTRDSPQICLIGEGCWLTRYAHRFVQAGVTGQRARMAGEISFVFSHGALRDALVARQNERLAAANTGRRAAHAGNARVITSFTYPTLVVVAWWAGGHALGLPVQYFITVCTSEAPQVIFTGAAFG